MANAALDFYCPKCGKKADFLRPGFIRYSVRRLQLLIFMCGDCRLIYLDKPTVRHLLKEWKNSGRLWAERTLRQLYKEFLDELEEMVKDFCKPEYGYKRARFVKGPPAPNP